MKPENTLYREPSEGMKKMYAEKKARTCKKVRDAIHLIKSENRKVTRKELIELTELSSATFSKEYVKEILKEEEVCQFRNIKKVRSNTNELKTIEFLTRENEKLTNHSKDLELKNEQLEMLLQKKIQESKDQQEDLILLKGRYQQALEYLEVLGADLKKLPIY